MYDDLAFRESRVSAKAVILYGAACIAGYVAVSAFGLPAVCAIAGLTVGFIAGQFKKK